MQRTIKLLFLILLCSVNGPVWAHHGVVSTFRFVDGLMHPWSGLGHWLLMLGLALFLYRRFSEAGSITILAFFSFCQGLAHIAGIDGEETHIGYMSGLVLSNVLLIVSIVLISRYFSSLSNRFGNGTSYTDSLTGFN